MTTQDDRADKLAFTQTGSGGLNDSKTSLGYARVSFSNDKELQKEKFI